MNNLSHRKDFWGMLERHAINVSIVEDDDHLNRKSGDDPALWSESLPFASYRQCGQNPEVIDRLNHRRYHKQVLNEKIRQQRRCLNDKPLTASNGCVQWQKDPPQIKSDGSQQWPVSNSEEQEIHLRDKKIWWISTDPTEDRSVKSSSHCNSLNDLRQITQNLVCRGLVSSGNQDVASTTKGWEHQQATQVAASTKEIHLRNRKNWRISTKVDSINFQRTGINSIGDSTVSIRPTKDPRATV